jgi:hypothetical protein
MRKTGKLAALSVICFLMVGDGWAQPAAGGPESPAVTPPMGWKWIRDLWKKADAGVFTKKYTTMIAAHGAVLIKAATQPQ